MRRRYGRLVCLAHAVLLVSLLCSGCMLVPFVAPNRKKVAPEFDKLAGRRVAILVWIDPSTLFDYPHARFELATYVGDKLSAEMSQRGLGTEVVDPRDVADFLQRTRSAEVDPQAVGRKLGADYVVFLEILTFQFRDPQQPQFLTGRIDAAVVVHDVHADPDQLKRYELNRVICTYPGGAPVILTATNSPFLREATYRKFAELVARKFYEYTLDLQ